MAIAYSSSGIGTANAALTASCNVTSSGSDRIAVIFCKWFTNPAQGAPTVTIGGSGTGVTQIGSTYNDTNDGRYSCAMFYCLGVPTASTQYLATWGTNVSGAAIVVATYSGVNQTTPYNGSLGTAEGEDTNATITVSSATGEVVVAGLAGAYNAGTGVCTADAGQNSRQLSYGYAGGGYAAGLSDEAGAASNVLSWTIQSAVWDVLAVRLNEAAAPSVTITDAGDEAYYNGETGITITGTSFGASQGGGSVKISPTDNVANAAAITQTVTSWADTSITFTAVKNSGQYTLPSNTNCYLFVTNNSSQSNASGHVVQLRPAPIVMRWSA